MIYLGIFDYCDKVKYPYGSVELEGEKTKVLHISLAVPGDIVEFDQSTQTIVSIKLNNFPYIAGTLLCTGPIMGIIKAGTVYRKFLTNNPNFPEVLVSCRKSQSCPNEYGIVTITRETEGRLYAKYISKIGVPGKLSDEREYFMYCHNIKHKKYPKKYNVDSYLRDLTPHRTDMTGMYAVSIDPKGCEDIDDALSIVEEDSAYVVNIHIADVSSFIPIGSDLDKNGKLRVESLYLNWGQEDMYPSQLVKVMSLFKDQNRRSFTVTVHLNKKTLDIIKVECTKSIVNINKNMTYKEFQEEYITDDKMKLLYTVGKYLYESGKVVKDIEVEYDSHKMVEVYMVLCNSVVATKICAVGKYLPICRSHREIDVSDMNLDFGDQNLHDIIRHHKALKAQYVLGKASHDSIGQDLYSHFTSPIRRYIDVISHRILYSSVHEANNVFDTSSFDEMLMGINRMHTLIQQSNRESLLLDKLYEYNLSGQTIINTKGNIVSINRNSVIVFCKEYDLEVRCSLYSNRISHLLTIEVTDISIKLTHNINHNKMILNIGDCVDLKIIVAFLELQLKKKVMGQLLSPDPMVLFNFFMYDTD